MSCSLAEWASAPAQAVVITDQLDPGLDWRSFRLGTVTFGETVVEVPASRAYYTTDVDLTDTLGVIVHVDAGINIVTGVVEWSLTAFDPDTGELPADPLVGLLPPNDPNTHSGEGSVTFVIRARSDVPTGTEITNEATIIFDSNPPIVTNEVFNTIDSGAPGSQISALPPTWPTPDIALQWSGADDPGGSGLARYSVYYRLDSGPYALWATTTDTAGTFTGAHGGGVYDFYSVATDNVGNAEAAPPVPDATTTIAAQVPAAPNFGDATAATSRLNSLGTANVDRIEHAVFDEATAKYVGANGRLVDEPFWQRLDQWSNVQVRALAASTEYRFRAKARDGAGETGFGPATVLTAGRAGDVDGDGHVNQTDLNIVEQTLGTQYGQAGFDARADLTGDDRVTFRDLNIVRRNLDPPPPKAVPTSSAQQKRAAQPMRAP